MQEKENPTIHNKSSQKFKILTAILFFILFVLAAYIVIKYFFGIFPDIKYWIISGVGLIVFIGVLLVSEKIFSFYGEEVPFVMNIFIILIFLIMFVIWRLIGFDPGNYSVTRYFFGDDLVSYRIMTENDEMSRYEFKQLLLNFMTEEEYKEDIKKSGLSENEYLDIIRTAPVNSLINNKK